MSAAIGAVVVNTRHAHAVLADGVATLTLREAGKLNILGSTAILGLTAAMQELAARCGPQGDLRVLVLRGEGEKAFIGGADIHEMAGLQPASAEAFIRRLRSLCDACRFFPAPVIARCTGYTLGGGLEVAMACDLRLAAVGSRFGMPEVAVGIPSVIHAVLLPLLIGRSRAAWMLTTGDMIDAATALQWGLVHECCEADVLDSRIAAVANRLSSFGPAALAQQKRLMREWESRPTDQAIESTVSEFGQAFATGEPQRHMQAFIDRKR
jgi:enoyl-CoA hydratase/carnithine racemase